MDQGVKAILALVTLSIGAPLYMVGVTSLNKRDRAAEARALVDKNGDKKLSSKEFADGLEMIEKLGGSSKDMTTARRNILQAMIEMAKEQGQIIENHE